MVVVVEVVVASLQRSWSGTGKLREPVVVVDRNRLDLKFDAY